MGIAPGTLYFQPDHGLDIEETHEAGDKMGVYHLFRYWWAWHVINNAISSGTALSNAVVWILGCGCGYGTRIIAEQHPELKILALDFDAQAINTANAKYRTDNILYLRADFDAYGIDQIPIEYKDPDFIVSFETIEFLQHRDLFLDSITRGLKKGGAFLFSTNHSGHERPAMRPEWTAQRVLYDTATITRILNRHFEDVWPAGHLSFEGKDFKDHFDKLIGDYAVGNNLFYCRGGDGREE